MPRPSCVPHQICKPSAVLAHLSLSVSHRMNAMLDLLRVPGKKGFSTTKLASFIAVILFSVAILWFAAPLVLAFLSSTVLRIWTQARSSTAPSYLFVAVNFIILTIWKLSESRALYSDEHRKEESDSEPDLIIPFRPADLVSAQAVHLLQKSSPEGHSKILSISAESNAGENTSPAPESELSCVTTESEENSVVSSSFNGLSAPQPALTAMDLEREEEAMYDCLDEDDSLDATWNAIMRKSGKPELSRSPLPVAAGRAAGRVATATPRIGIALPEGNDKINQRFDDFIKKNYDQIRLTKLGDSNQPSRIN